MSNLDALRPNEDGLINTQQAAAILGVSAGTVSRMAREDRLEVAHQGNGIRGPRLFAEDDVYALRTRRTLQGGAHQ